MLTAQEIEEWYDVDDASQVMEMRLCEQRHVILKPDQLYLFTVDPACKTCREMAARLVF